MGFDLTNFVGDVDEEFLCSICKQVLDNPLQLKCEHIYCYECIRQWVSLNASCPDDRSTVVLEEMQTPGRCYLNLLNKLRMKCDFYLKGCQTITQLEYIDDHLSSCEFNPNAEVVCSKGCGMTMRRHEYEGHECIMFLVNLRKKQEKENFILTNETAELSHELQLQVERFDRLNEVMKNLREQLAYFKNAVNGPDASNISSNAAFNLFSDGPRKWKVCDNMKINPLQPHILELNDYYRYSFAQSLFPIAPSKFNFKIQVLNVENSFGCILIGLTREGHPIDKIPGADGESISYSSHGESLDEGRTNLVGSKWRNGDIIEVGIQYPSFSNRAEPVIYFKRNELLITEKFIWPSFDVEVYPTIRMIGKGSKVRCLNN